MGDSLSFEKQKTFEEKRNGAIEAVRELHKPIEGMLTEMAPDIRSCKYTILVSDDTSGRIPAVIFQQVINAIYKEHEIPPLLFQGLAVSGTTPFPLAHRARKRLHSLVRESAGTRVDVAPKALIVTDMIDRGTTIARLGKLAFEAGLPFDIGVIQGSERQNVEPVKGVRYIEGHGSANFRFLRLKSGLNINLSGLEKPMLFGPFTSPARLKGNSREIVKATYDEAQKVGNELISWWRNQPDGAVVKSTI